MMECWFQETDVPRKTMWHFVARAGKLRGDLLIYYEGNLLSWKLRATRKMDPFVSRDWEATGQKVLSIDEILYTAQALFSGWAEACTRLCSQESCGYHLRRENDHFRFVKVIPREDTGF